MPFKDPNQIAILVFLNKRPNWKLLSFVSFGLEQSSFYHFLFIVFRNMYLFVFLVSICLIKGKEDIPEKRVHVINASCIPFVRLVTEGLAHSSRSQVILQTSKTVLCKE